MFGYTDRFLEPLHALAYADWHVRHEDVASALSDIRSQDSVDALVHLTNWVPEYLAFDDACALAENAIWGLRWIGNEPAKRALAVLARSENAIVAAKAAKRLNEASQD